MTIVGRLDSEGRMREVRSQFRWAERGGAQYGHYDIYVDGVHAFSTIPQHDRDQFEAFVMFADSVLV